mgnify:CR=1 FL=1
MLNANAAVKQKFQEISEYLHTDYFITCYDVAYVIDCCFHVITGGSEDIVIWDIGIPEGPDFKCKHK